MKNEDRHDLPWLLRAATAIGLVAAVLGTGVLAWMADASLDPDAAAASRESTAAAESQGPQEIVTASRQVAGSVR